MGVLLVQNEVVVERSADRMGALSPDRRETWVDAAGRTGCAMDAGLAPGSMAMYPDAEAAAAESRTGAVCVMLECGIALGMFGTFLGAHDPNRSCQADLPMGCRGDCCVPFSSYRCCVCRAWEGCQDGFRNAGRLLVQFLTVSTGVLVRLSCTWSS